MKTLLLDLNQWDLLTDAAGNIALASEPYAIAQDVASAIKLFSGELWYDTSAGVPYFAEILGHALPLPAFRQYMVSAALTVPLVVTATCSISKFQDRTITGQLVFTDSIGRQQTVGF